MGSSLPSLLTSRVFASERIWTRIYRFIGKGFEKKGGTSMSWRTKVRGKSRHMFWLLCLVVI